MQLDRDRFSAKYVIFSAAVFVLYPGLIYLGAHSSAGGDLLVLFFFYFVVCPGYAVLFAKNLFQRNFRRVVSILLGIAVLVPMIYARSSIERAGSFAIDHGRFALWRAHYEDLVRKHPANDEGSKVIFFDWGGGGFILTNVFYELVYDNTGEIERPDNQRSKKWKDMLGSARQQLFESCNVGAKKLADNFYSLTTWCS